MQSSSKSHHFKAVEEFIIAKKGKYILTLQVNSINTK